MLLVCLHAPDDRAYREKLDKHLAPLKRGSKLSIETWHPDLVPPGSKRQVELAQHLQKATLIIVLVSAYFLNSDQCVADLHLALDVEREYDTPLIPVVVSPVI